MICNHLVACPPATTRAAPLAGVLLTHLHLDHVSGMRDVPRGTPIYSGPRETRDREFMYLFTQGTIDRQLEGQAPIQAWRFAADPSGRFAGVTDIFGDGSVFAILVPGHTTGSVAYLVRTPKGPVLFTGDTCHTRWGWDHDVEPGSFSAIARRTRPAWRICGRWWRGIRRSTYASGISGERAGPRRA